MLFYISSELDYGNYVQRQRYVISKTIFHKFVTIVGYY
jgi:hypothetical protein